MYAVNFLKKIPSKSLLFQCCHLHRKNFIGYKLQDPSPTSVNDAVTMAMKAFPDLKNKHNGKTISVFLSTIADELTNISKDLIQVVMKETYYPEQRVQVELTRTINQLKMYSEVAKEGSYVEARIVRKEGQPDLRRMLQPIGPVAVFGASNFPLAYSVAGGDTASALAARCPVVIKEHPAHPETSEMVAEAIVTAAKKTDMPEGVFNMVKGDVDVGVELVKHPGIQGVGFTGSVRGGRAIFDIATQRPKPIPVYAEMGSINPIVILPEAMRVRAKEIAQGFCDSFTLSGGQYCTNPGLVFTVGDNTEFMKTLKEAVTKVKPFRLLTEGITRSFHNGIATFLKVKGVNCEYRLSAEAPHVGATILSTNIDTFVKHSDTLTEEIFGPVTLIVQCKNIDELFKGLSVLDGQLTSTIHAEPTDQHVKEIAEKLSEICGRLILNGYPTGVTVCSAMHHGGPYPATTDIRTGAVGKTAIKRWLRPICFQNFTTREDLLPDELKLENPKKICREENDIWKKP